ncbi:MAG: DUF5106 domain-containing protein [Bacteroidales bacterium]|nr:DUF5106 domain-containing protein [Bacteroidales bacterium]
MRKLRYIIGLFILFFSTNLFGQSMEIKVTAEKQNFDSLTLCEFKDFKYQKLYTVYANKSLVFKSKQALTPGIYMLKADTNDIVELLISDKESQKFSINLGEKTIGFTNSEENAAHAEYLTKIAEFTTRLSKIEKEFMNTQNGTLPEYMKNNMLSNLADQARKIEKEKSDYIHALADKYSDKLLSSVIKCELELPPAPQQCYQNRLLMFHYIAQHTFDIYPFEDVRLNNTKMASDKIKQYGTTLYQFEGSDAEPYIKPLLKKLNTCDAETYFFFFDNLERTIGSLKSPFWCENLYIIMLKDALARPDLDKARSIRYTDQLGRLDKNLRGSTLPNFKIMLSNDTVTDLYSIESEFLILYFQNPDCPTCTDYRNRMSKMDVVNKAIEAGHLKVLTVYFEEDEALWRRYLEKKANPLYIHAWDYTQEIESKELFDLRIIPYVFLLDKDKKVIKKDLLINEIEDYVKRYVVY